MLFALCEVITFKQGYFIVLKFPFGISGKFDITTPIVHKEARQILGICHFKPNYIIFGSKNRYI